MTERKPYLVAGEWRSGEEAFEVKSPYDGAVVTEVDVSTDAHVEEAGSRAAETF